MQKPACDAFNIANLQILEDSPSCEHVPSSFAEVIGKLSFV